MCVRVCECECAPTDDEEVLYLDQSHTQNCSSKIFNIHSCFKTHICVLCFNSVFKENPSEDIYLN